MPRTRSDRFTSLRMLATLTGLVGFLALNGAGGGDGGASGEGAPAGDGNDGQGGAGEPGGAGAPADPPAPKIEFTKEQQAEVDRIAAERASKAAEKATKAAQEEATKAAERAKMEEGERLKAEKADAEKAAADATAKADAKVVRSDAKAAALVAGLNPERTDAFMRLVDLSDVKVNDDGDADPKALAKAIDAAFKLAPELKGTTKGGPGKSGGEFNDHAGAGKPRTLAEAVDQRLAS